MSRKMVSVDTLHGFSIDELINLNNKNQDVFGYTMLSIVINRYKGMKTHELSKLFNKSIPTIIDYIHKWNELGLDALVDKRGGSEGTFTDEMFKTIKHAIDHENPLDYGFESETWTISMLIDIIESKFKKRYSYEWIRQVVKNNNYTYKRGQYKPTNANEEEQKLFKKNARSTEYCRKFY
jgi:transposase